MSSLRYVYAVVDAAAASAIPGAGPGIEGGAVEAIVESGLAAAATSVPEAVYEETPLNERLQDIDWLAPRAQVHQDVNARLLDRAGSVVPLAFGAIYRGPDGVRAMLRSLGDDLHGRLRRLAGRAEWIVSVEREGEPAPTDALRALDREIAAAPPGRAFLLAKRRDEVVREQRRAQDAAVADETASALERVSEDVYREPLIDDAASAAVARFSVLAPRADAERLAAAVGDLGASQTARGYRLRLSGPWPAYRFGGLPSERVGAR